MIGKKFILVGLLLIMSVVYANALSLNEVKNKYYTDDPNNNRHTKMLIYGNGAYAACDISGKCEYEFIVWNDNASQKTLNFNTLLKNINVNVTKIEKEGDIAYNEFKSVKTQCTSINTTSILDGNGTRVNTYRCSNNNSLVDNNVLAYYYVETPEVKTKKGYSVVAINSDGTLYQPNYYNPSEIKKVKKVNNISIPANDYSKFKVSFNVPKNSNGQFFLETDDANSFLDPWWNVTYNYQAPLNILNSRVLDVNSSSFTVVLNTQALISGAKMQADCDDLRIVRHEGGVQTELSRIIAANSCNTAGTIIRFRPNTPHPVGDINSTDANGYYIYYGNAIATITEDLNYMPNLVTYFQMDFNNGLNYYDSSINHLLGIANLTSPTPGRYSKALKIDLANASLDFNAWMPSGDMNWGSTKDFTIQVDMNANPYDAGQASYGFYRLDPVGSNYVSISIYSTLFRYGHYPGGATDYAFTPANDTWLNFAVQRKDINTYNNFYNGTKVASTTAASDDYTPYRNNASVGGNANLVHFNVDSLMVWQYAPNDFNASQAAILIGTEAFHSSEIPPDINFTYPTNGSYLNHNIDINFNVYDGDSNSWLVDLNWSYSPTIGTGTPILLDRNTTTSSFYCQPLDDGFGTIHNCGLRDYNFAGVPDGNIYFLVDFNDNSTTASDSAISNSFVRDTNKPVTYWNKDVNKNTWTRYDWNIGLNYFDINNLSPMSSIKYRVNLGAWTNYTGVGILINWDGNTSIDFNSTDLSTNIGDINRQYILRDTTAPALVLISPSSNTSGTSVTPTFFASFSDANNSIGLCDYVIYKNLAPLHIGTTAPIGGTCSYTFVAGDGLAVGDTAYATFDINDSLGNNSADMNTGIYTVIEAGGAPPSGSPAGGGSTGGFASITETTVTSLLQISQSTNVLFVQDGATKKFWIDLKNLANEKINLDISISDNFKPYIKILTDLKTLERDETKRVEFEAYSTNFDFNTLKSNIIITVNTNAEVDIVELTLKKGEEGGIVASVIKPLLTLPYIGEITVLHLIVGAVILYIFWKR